MSTESEEEPQNRVKSRNLLGDEVLATALLDRILHHAEVIAINGRSYRMKERQVDRVDHATQPARMPIGAPSTGVR